jgi:hypothetical protein
VRVRGWTADGLLVKAIAEVESSVKYDARYLRDNGVPFRPREKPKSAADVAREHGIGEPTKQSQAEALAQEGGL